MIWNKNLKATQVNLAKCFSLGFTHLRHNVLNTSLCYSIEIAKTFGHRVVHLGFGPKIRGLMMIDELRQAGIPVMHSLASDSLSEQLRDAEKKGVAFTLIIGQKEYVENTVILRDMGARNQEFIDQASAIKKLKRKKVAVA